MPDTPPTGNAPLHRGAATEIEEIHQYIYAGGKLLRETISDGTTTKTLDFNYDNVGLPYSLIYNNGTATTTYYYITNLQGDVMYLVDSSGNEVSAYDYDPYGKIIFSATGSMAEVNPLRYRGYYYDTETGFYYLQSRYYDPEICRFINADGYASTGQGYLGYNTFVYCNNNPVNSTDPTGEFWIEVLKGIANAAISGMTTKIFGGTWKEAAWSAVEGFVSSFGDAPKTVIICIDIFASFCHTLNKDYSWPYFLISTASKLLFSKLNASSAEQLSDWFSKAMLNIAASCMDKSVYELEESWFPTPETTTSRNRGRLPEADTTVVLPRGGGAGSCGAVRSARAKFICYVN